jgi:FKBP-type peptidyl-prolyl cis-trans isomerase
MKLKLKLITATLVAGLGVLSVQAGGSSSPTTNIQPPDKAQLSYAVGTRLGLQILDVKNRIDTHVAIQAIQDVLDGKPTMIQESEIGTILNHAPSPGAGGQTGDDKTKFSYAGGMRAALIFKQTSFDLDSKIVCQAIDDEVDGKSKMEESETVALFKQAATYEKVKKASSNRAEGESFLAKNAKVPGVTVLPDGLQYQITEPGTGPLATTNDLIYIKYRGTFINGTEFDSHNHYLTRTYGGIQGWRDVLPRMKVGSKWRIFVPSDLAFGDGGLPHRGVNAGTTVIYDLELVSIAPPGGSYQISSAMGHGADIDASSPDSAPAK